MKISIGDMVTATIGFEVDALEKRFDGTIMVKGWAIDDQGAKVAYIIVPECVCENRTKEFSQ